MTDLRRLFSLACLGLFVLLVASGTRMDAAYTYSRAITIDHTRVPNTDQTNFPVLISTTDPLLKSAANGGHVNNSNGYDLIFTSDSGCSSMLSFERELWSATTGQLNAWVKVPTVSHGTNTVIYLCYGNSAINTDQSNKTAVWDSNYKGVWHLPNGTTLSATDSTSSANNGTLYSSPTATTGQIDGAAAFNTANYIGNGTASSLYSTNITVEAWLKATSLVNVGAAVAEFVGTPPNRNWVLGLGSGGTSWRFAIQSGSTQYNAGGGTVNTGVWHHLVGTYNGATEYLYLDGAAIGTTSVNATLNTSNNLLVVGARSDAGFGWAGSIDEVRYSNIARSADWITTEYNNQSNPATFYSIATEGGGGGSVTLSPTSATKSAGGGTGSISVTASGSWTATSNQSWLTITSGASGTGNGTINYSVSYNTGSQRVGTITVNTQTFTLTEQASNGQLPTQGSVNPSSGTGLNQTFSYVASDTNGFGYIQEVDGSLYGLCHVYVKTATGNGYIYNDSSGQSSSAVLLGSLQAATMGNCTLWGSGSSISGNGNNLTAALHLSFPTAASGTYTNQMAVEDWAGNYSSGPWANVGTWTVGTATETVTTPGPATGPSVGAYGVAYTYQTTGGSTDNLGNPVQYIFNWGDSTSPTVATQQGSYWRASHTWANSGSWNVTVQGQSQTNPSVVSAAVPNPPLSVLIGVSASLTPTSGSGSSATFSISGSDYAGITSANSAFYMIMNSSLNAASACFIAYIPSSNTIVLSADNASNSNWVWVGSGVIGQSNPATLSNSQCTVNVSGSTISNQGTYAETLNVPITFTPAFASGTAKTLYVDVNDNGSPVQSTGWLPLGTWTVTSSGQTTVTSSPAGRSIAIDGTACTTPCTTTAGSHTLTIPSPTQSGGTGIQYVFSAWSDGTSTLPKTVSLTSGSTFTANFTTQYYLTTSASPSSEGSIAPASGWYNAGQVVSVAATAANGYQFTGFSNGLTGTTTPQNVTMSAPVTVVASFGVVTPTSTVKEYIRMGGKVIAVENTPQ